MINNYSVGYSVIIKRTAIQIYSMKENSCEIVLYKQDKNLHRSWQYVCKRLHRKNGQRSTPKCKVWQCEGMVVLFSPYKKFSIIELFSFC